MLQELHSSPRRPQGGRSGQASRPKLIPLNDGSRLGHYRVTGLIGEGGMGDVYRTRNRRWCALKHIQTRGLLALRFLTLAFVAIS